MLKITNTYILVDKEFIEKYRDFMAQVLSSLTFIDKQTLEKQPMYIISDGVIKIPIGYINYINIDYNSPDVQDLRTSFVPFLAFDQKSIGTILSKIEKILPNITLRKDQVISVLYALNEKSGIFQLATGAGKTEIISAIIKYWHDELNYFPNVIILEPTTKLVSQTIERLKRYGIDSSEYNCDRQIEGIKVTHPASLYNDVNQNPEHLKALNCIICDEGHHLSAITWRSILEKSPILEVRIAFSASIIDHDKVNNMVLDSLDYDENLIVGVTGKVLVNYPPSYYIESGILATPIVFRVYNKADEPMKIKNRRNFYKYNGVDYQSIKKYRLGSNTRIEKTVDTLVPLIERGLKILILAETKDFAYSILDKFRERGLDQECRTVFGGNETNRLNPVTKEIEREEENAINLLTSGKIHVIIATSVLYEGADIPVLDAVVLYSIGIEQRVFIQGIGRVLRKGKSGKYAYIIDFTDHEDSVLRKHSLRRRDMYIQIIGVKEENLFDGLQTHEILEKYLLLET